MSRSLGRVVGWVALGSASLVGGLLGGEALAQSPPRFGIADFGVSAAAVVGARSPEPGRGPS